NFSEYRNAEAEFNKLEKWRPHVGWYELFDIVTSKISKHPAVASGQKSGKLSDVLGADEFEKMRREIKDFLFSIPREYELWVELPSMPRWGIGDFSISKRIS